MNPAPATLDAYALQKQLNELRLAVKGMLTLVIASLACINLGLITFVAPKFAKIFDDMIPGGRTRLPLLTQATIHWSYLTPAPQLAIIGIALVALVALWMWRSNIWPCVIAMAAMFLLVAHWVTTAASCFLPLISVIESLSQP